MNASTTHRISLRCRRCGAEFDIDIAERQSEFVATCPAFCGARATGAAHWALGRTDPILVFAEKSEILSTT
jgi:hypothetical protein